jgi:hypothetical protein
MLKRLQLTDFKSFVDEAVEIAPLTVLVGANASGKSNFLDAIQFLKGTNFDLSLAEVLNGEEQAKPDAWPGIRGRAPEAARVGTSIFTITSAWISSSTPTSHLAKEMLDLETAQIEFSHKISCRTEPHPRLEAESLFDVNGRALFSTGGIKSGNRIEVPWKIPHPLGGETPTLVDTDRSVLWEVLGSRGPLSPQIPADVVFYSLLMSEVLNWVDVLNIRPEEMRSYGRRGAVLGPEGKNVSGVLAEATEKPDDKRSLVEWLSRLCAPELIDIDFIEVKELGDVMTMFVEKGGKRISVRSLSDGTLRFLGTLLALRLAPPGTVLLIEDIEIGLHPTRIRLLVEYLEAVVRERGVQIIATTHSPVVLQWLSEEFLRSTLIFGRVPENEGTIVRRLGDLPHFEQVAQRTGIEELFTTGWLEMAI